MKSSSFPDAPSANNKVKLYLVGAVVLLVLGVILYFVGLMAGKAQLSAQAAKFGVERNGLQSQVTTAQAARDAALNRASLMEARAALYRTTIDLDARNFGTANSHLQEAATALSHVKAPDTAALQQEIKTTDLNVAVNLGDQRAKVLDFADQLNKITPAEVETPASTDNAPAVPAAP